MDTDYITALKYLGLCVIAVIIVLLITPVLSGLM